MARPAQAWPRFGQATARLGQARSSQGQAGQARPEEPTICDDTYCRRSPSSWCRSRFRPDGPHRRDDCGPIWDDLVPTWGGWGRQCAVTPRARVAATPSAPAPLTRVCAWRGRKGLAGPPPTPCTTGGSADPWSGASADQWAAPPTPLHDPPTPFIGSGRLRRPSRRLRRPLDGSADPTPTHQAPPPTPCTAGSGRRPDGFRPQCGNGRPT